MAFCVNVVFTSSPFSDTYSCCSTVADQAQVDPCVDDCFRMTVFANGSLLIHSVTSSDEGFYSCVGIPGDSNQVPQTYTAELSIACELCLLS